MKVAIVSVQVPFISGGAEFLASGLKAALIERKISAEIVTIPFKWYPPKTILDQVKIAQLTDITEVNGEKIDKAICLKFPAYYCQHNNKTLWLLHQHRQAYDLYNTPFGDLHQTRSGKRVSKKIKKLDSQLIPHFKSIYTISQNVADRLRNYNGIQTDAVVYPPPANIEQFECHDYENYILYPSRFSLVKRQELIVRAMQLISSKTKLILVGDFQDSYSIYIKRLIDELSIQDKVILKHNISEKEKISLYANCLAVYNGVFDEDYGYVTIEAFLSAKSVITHTDSGGPLEFVTHESNGFVISPEPMAIAKMIDKLSNNKKQAILLGQNARETLKQKNISWDYTIEKLLS